MNNLNLKEYLDPEKDLTLYHKDGKIYSMGWEFINMFKGANIPLMIGGGKNNFSFAITNRQMSNNS